MTLTTELFQALDGFRLWFSHTPLVLATGLYSNGRGGIVANYGWEEDTGCKHQTTPTMCKVTVNVPDLELRDDEFFVCQKYEDAICIAHALVHLRIIEPVWDCKHPPSSKYKFRFALCDHEGDVQYAATCPKCNQRCAERYDKTTLKYQAREVMRAMSR